MSSKIKFVVVHRRDENNVGDIASNPLQYFLKEDEYQSVDITKLDITKYPTDVPVIVGGGGLIANNFFGNAIEQLLDVPDRSRLKELWKLRWKLFDETNKKIHEEFIEDFENLVKSAYRKIPDSSVFRAVWGAGHNSDDIKLRAQKLEYPDYLIDFDLVGVRDHNTGYQWVPCASCMHPALHKEYAIKNDVIWFEHKKQLVKNFGNESIPRFVNSGNNVDQAIELIGSSNIVITNSYHGAYWATLMKKRVIVVDAWSSKFNFMKHKPYFIDSRTDWKDVIDDVKVYDGALAECCNTTEEYWKKIKDRT